MLSVLDQVLAEPRLERMLGFNQQRHGIATETQRRAAEEKIAAARDRSALEIVLNDVCFHEADRFRKTKSIDENDKQLRARVSRLRKGLRKMSDDELRQAIVDLVRFYVDDINGNFSPFVYAVVTRVIPVGLSVLFSPVKLSWSRSFTDLSQLRERILIEGQVADLARLARKGTLVVVPTHLSNLDSIVIGFALERSLLPPCTYGAGKNLWSNPVLGFFMRNLGAYRVDRRIKHDLYKDVLKTYSTVLLERGYHSLFFPGGTRSRSGAIEQHLKLGLAGTALKATVNLMARHAGGARPIYVVPATINYPFVLEAATLVDDWLREAGKSRYIIEDDESSQVGRVARYVRDLLRSAGSMTIQFSEPLDVLGHRVGPDGESYDDRGRPVELRPFFTVNGEIRADAARDAEYTRELGEKIAARYLADTHVLPTHLVAYVMHRMLIKHAPPKTDLFRLMRGADPMGAIADGEVLGAIDRVKTRLAEMASRRQVRLGALVAGGDARRILDEALAAFALFQESPALRREEGGIAVDDRPLCYYYHNRLERYGLAELV